MANREAVIVSTARTPIGKAYRGAFNATPSPTLASHAIKAAVVHLAPGATATEQELKAWVRERLAIFKTPVRIVFLPHPLPRNANGKILKDELKTLFD